MHLLTIHRAARGGTGVAMALIGMVLFEGVAACAYGQRARPIARQNADASWAKTYATSCGPTIHVCAPSTDGYEDAFNGDPRLPGLLRRSLPQGESWWVNGHGGSAPVSSIVQQFIGVPNSLRVDDNRYVTATGCVPRDCTTSGMLWIDTGIRPATVIFVAEFMIQSFRMGNGNHLWIYSSRRENFEALPPDFLSSLKRWQGPITSGTFPQVVTLATLVQPNGRMRDLTYDMLFFKQQMNKLFHKGPGPAKQ